MKTPEGPVRLEPRTPGLRVKHLTIESQRIPHIYAFAGFHQYKARAVKCLAQRNSHTHKKKRKKKKNKKKKNTVDPVQLESVAPRSQVLRCATRPRRIPKTPRKKYLENNICEKLTNIFSLFQQSFLALTEKLKACLQVHVSII